MQDLANIKQIIDLHPHTNADTLELAIIEGWQCVVKKGEFQIGDLVVYVSIDTRLTGNPSWASFLETRNWRVRLIKLRGELSYGLILKTDVLPPEILIEDGLDVSKILGVEKYEKPESNVGGPGTRTKARSITFPRFLGWSITDEVNIQSKKRLLEELRGQPYYFSVKADGSSASFGFGLTLTHPDGELIVATRKQWVDFNDDSDDNWSKVVRKYNLVEILEKNREWAIQAELVGPAIQKNRLGLIDHEIRIFNIFNTTTRKYGGFSDLKNFCQKTGLPMVEILEEGENFQYELSKLLEFAAKTKYPNGHPAEGMVVRPQEEMYSSCLRDRLSFKVLNSTYLLKYEI